MEKTLERLRKDVNILATHTGSLVIKKEEKTLSDNIVEDVQDVIDFAERAVVLLSATRDLFEKQLNSYYVLNLLSETTFFDGVECDGNCLLEDIDSLLFELESDSKRIARENKWLKDHCKYCLNNEFRDEGLVNCESTYQNLEGCACINFEEDFRNGQ